MKNTLNRTFRTNSLINTDWYRRTQQASPSVQLQQSGGSLMIRDTGQVSIYRDVRPLRYSNQDGQAEGEHVNRGRDTPKFLFYLTGARYVLPAVSVLIVAQASS
jgi:hypothetical protein